MLKIKEILKEKGLTQSELAEKMGITRITVVKTLAGNPTVETLQRIADAVGVNVLDLFEDTREEKIQEYLCPHCGQPISVELKQAK